ncbi:MAG: universal stress protein [Chloroflexi bacterium]|nr:universal stress protein [Chloroflexota bacterium]
MENQSPAADFKAQRILVPLDGSRLAEAVLGAVALFAGRYQATVILLHVIEQRPPATIHGEHHLADTAEAQAYLEGVATRLRSISSVSYPIEIHVHREGEGDVARSIVLHTQEIGSNLIVLCTHGRGGLKDLFYGSIALQVLQHGTCPILMIPPAEGRLNATTGSPLDPTGIASFALEQILVPLDGLPSHEQGFTVAAAIAGAFKAQMHLVLVIPTLSTLSGGQALTGLLLPGTMRAVLDLARQGGVDYLQQLLDRCRLEALAASAEIIRGDPVPAVLDLAGRLDIGLIIMASHGKTGLDAFLSGSVAPRIALRAVQPLLLIRVAEEDDTP